MKELRIFIRSLKRQGFQIISIGEVGEKIEFKNVDELIGVIQVREVIAEYYNSFEFIDIYGKYIEINAIC